MRKSALVLSIVGATLALATPATAWVHYHGGGAWRGPAGGVHTWHGGVTVGGPRWGYGWHGGCCWNGGYPASAVAGAAAAGAIAGAAVGAAATSATVGSYYNTLPGGCVQPSPGIWVCGGVYYKAYYGPNGVVYRVVPAP